MAETNVTEQFIDLESMLVQFSEALNSAAVTLKSAFDYRPELAELPFVYQIPKMSVSVKVSFTVTNGKVKGLFTKTTSSSSQEVVSTIQLDILATPRLAEAKERVLELTVPPMTGEDVRLLQMRLGAAGFVVAPDGEFGAETVQALIKLQRANGLNPAGKYDAETKKRLEGKSAS